VRVGGEVGGEEKEKAPDVRRQKKALEVRR
jgi:hypothetical protein